MPIRALQVLPLISVLLACGGEPGSGSGGGMTSRPPDELPVMLNREPPFRYPPALYARHVQGNVILRLFIDRDGRVRPESTMVMETSGHAELDSSAVVGSEALRFVPAKSAGEPHALSVLFPVLFRHPAAPPLPGDTALQPRIP